MSIFKPAAGHNSAQSADQFHQHLLSLPSDLPNLFDWSDRVILRVEGANFEHKV